MPLPTLSYSQSSSTLHLNGPSASNLPPPPASSISLPSLWHSLVEHGSNKRKALTVLHEQNLAFVQSEVERIAAKFDLSAQPPAHSPPSRVDPSITTLPSVPSISDVPLSVCVAVVLCPWMSRCRPLSGVGRTPPPPPPLGETKAERLVRLQAEQQEAIESMQKALLKDEVLSPSPPPSPSSPSPSSSDAENLPPPASSPPPKPKARKPRKKATASDADASTQGDDSDAPAPSVKRTQEKAPRRRRRRPSLRPHPPAPKRKPRAKAADAVDEPRPVRTRAAAKKAEGDTKDTAQGRGS